ncbi:MAG: zinc ribbon domain-containing protein [Terrimesophilobacter sp.]
MRTGNAPADTHSHRDGRSRSVPKAISPLNATRCGVANLLNMERCARCGRAVAPEWKFCVYCGQAVAAPDTPDNNHVPAAIRPVSDPVTGESAGLSRSGRFSATFWIAIAMAVTGLVVIIFALVQMATTNA